MELVVVFVERACEFYKFLVLNFPDLKFWVPFSKHKLIVKCYVFIFDVGD